MRRDSELLLKKLLEYREEIKSDILELNINDFKEIPNIDTAMKDILNDLIHNNMLTSKSQIINLEGDLELYPTLDGIEYFDSKEKEKSLSSLFNISGTQVNIAQGNTKINDEFDKAIIDNKISDISGKNIHNNKKKKVFISYSWTPESNKTWVEKLVSRLESDGIEVVVDSKKLRLGHDKYRFMEQMVSDNTIDKVLIICNKTYKEKADDRVGGVGDESTIITPYVYGNAIQERFIPVVNEYDDNARPYLPNYIASRMYADLVDFERGYKELLENITGNYLEDNSVDNEKSNNRYIEGFNSSSVFFDDRLRMAFPGVRGLKEYTDPEVCVDRLGILLKNPLKGRKSEMKDPIWWFRGSVNDCISKFEKLSTTKFLMYPIEVEVKRIIVCVTPDYYRNFIYVETLPDKQIGIYDNIDKQYIKERIKEKISVTEEYGIYNGNIITRAEYDDGAAEINGKIIEFDNNPELRMRYLTPFNFVICAKRNPINNSRFDRILNSLFDGLLDGTLKIEEFVDYCKKLPANKNDI